MKAKLPTEDVVIHGVIADLRPARGPHPHLKWRAVLDVDSTVSGRFFDEHLTFHIHSPEKAGIVVGGRYEISLAVRVDGTFELKGIRPWNDDQPRET
ncbi:MAG: hypothetical protein RQ826_09430 [Xanthomonadales bacterium]|nr:hypothetical protein [Xanthomonadales bacterium]